MEGFCLVCNNYWKQIFKLNLAVFESEKLRCIACIRKLLFLPQSPFQELLNKSVICEDCVHKVLETEKMMHELELLQGRIVQTRRDVEAILIRSHNQVVGPADKMTMEHLDNINTKATRRQIIDLLRLKTDGIPAASPFAMLATTMEQQNSASESPTTSTSMPANDSKRKRGRPFKIATGGKMMVKYKGIIPPSRPVAATRRRKLLDSHRTYNDEYPININGNNYSHVQDMDESMKMECFKNHPTVSLLRLSPMSSSIKLSEDVTINDFMKKESVLLSKKKKAFVAANRKGRKRKLFTAAPKIKIKAKAIRTVSKRKRKIKLTEKAKLNNKLLDNNEDEIENDDEYFVEPEELKKMVQKARKVTKGAKPGDFMCGICSLSFESMDILNIHMNIHIGPNKTETETATTNSISSSAGSGFINCQQCSKKFNSEKSLSDHERAVHVKKCNKCDLMFSSEEALTLHSVSHKPQPKRRAVIINCDQCDETFSTSYLLNLHNTSHHSKRRTTYNSFEAKTKTPLTTTTKSTTTTATTNATATTISKLNNDDSRLENSSYELVNENGNDHSLATSSYEIVNENGNDDINSSGDEDDQKFACEVCKKKFFSALVLKLHSLKHRSCEICSLVFSTPEAFSAHRVSSHPDPNSKNPQNTHVCVLCEVSFLSKDILDKHQREAHTANKEYDDSPPILDEIHTTYTNKLNHSDEDDDDLLNNSSSPPKLEEFATPSIKDFRDMFSRI